VRKESLEQVVIASLNRCEISLLLHRPLLVLLTFFNKAKEWVRGLFLLCLAGFIAAALSKLPCLSFLSRVRVGIVPVLIFFEIFILVNLTLIGISSAFLIGRSAPIFYYLTELICQGSHH
jgi:hypothetical protein